VLKELSIDRSRRSDPLPSSGRPRSDQVNALAFDVRAALFALLGKNITQIDGLGPYLSLKLIAECGDDLSAWPSAKHFTSWLGLAPSNKISGGKIVSSRTRRCGSRASALLRLAAVSVGRTDTALGAFYRRLSARIEVLAGYLARPLSQSGRQSQFRFAPVGSPAISSRQTTPVAVM
jgi:transposase